LAAQEQTSDSLTVDQAVRRALETHPALMQARAAIRVSETRVLQAGLPLAPEVTAEAGYTRLDPVSEFSVPGLGGLKLFSPNNYDVHIGVRSTLYDFGKTASVVDVSRSRVRSSQDALELSQQALAVQTQRIFYAILLFQKSIPVQDEQLAALNEHLRVIERRVQSGTATSFDVLTTQVRIAAAENQRIDLVNGLARQESEFRRLLGFSAGAPVHVRGDFFRTANITGVPADSLVSEALSRRLESIAARDAEETAKLQQRSAELGTRPMIKAAVNYGFKNGFEPNFDVLRGNWAASLKFELPVYDGGRSEYQQEEAEASAIAEHARTFDVERQIRAEVEQTTADLQASIQKLEGTQPQLRHAHEAVVIARLRYESGSVTNLDLLDAETAETVARLAQLQSAYKVVLSSIELERARGKRY
ncbi:MAG TPA: TolC family protein, partial [Bacteroidota bacterium]|nr:TolC family protein [Bacteroidota bacterium]